MSTRATSPVLGIVLLLVITTVLAGAVGTAALGTTVPADHPRAAIDVRIDADASRLTFVHRGGETLYVRNLSVRIRIDGTPLDSQPPVPFFSAEGFRPGPTGPFNTATDDRWTAGESASVRLAGTNDPALSSGSRVVVTLAVGETVVAKAESVV